MTERPETAKPAEAWLRGPVYGVPPLLQPVAHALVQARDEVREITREFPDDKLWLGPAGAASPGFHLQHLSGVVDRLFTYARGESLNASQLDSLGSEGGPRRPDLTAMDLYRDFEQRVEIALDQLRVTPEYMLTERRTVGRTGLPSTVQGLLFHAAEHVQRHLGQLLVTAKVVRETAPDVRPPAIGVTEHQ